jgi:PD-(D/E)XK nuclease superfamily protein
MVGKTSARGDLSEMEIATALMRAGMTVLRPLSAAVRYALVIDAGGGAFTRIQCKTGILRNGRILFRVCSADARRPLGVS